jgi:WD40 repeat protein/serine/threonine protein kinase
MSDNQNRPDQPPRRTPAVDAKHGSDLSNDQTIDLSSFDEKSKGDPNETVEIKPEPAMDPYATNSLAELDPAPASIGESTIVPEPMEGLEAIEVKAVPEASRGDSSESTIALSDLDQTIEFGELETNTAKNVGQTKNLFDTTSVEEPASPPSVLYDTNVTQTINPRELSAEDAAFWGSLSRGTEGSSQPIRLSPAINRSLSETKLHLRGQVVSPAHSELAKQSDYRLVRLLGKGGMGNVYVARQGSLDRLVALKVIKPLEEEKKKRFKQRGNLEQVEQERRLQFISEAVVTGDLDHPNIVPIHDIAVTGDDTLFYSMKRVSGMPWSKVIAEKSRDENIDILLKVCDAIGFAHTRGVVHRDIKPENIMLGEFGVVMVMDWGLALAKPEFEKLESVHQSTGLGGSPAYMAPEMAMGPVDRIGPESDVYLLGATLFQIITSWAPHYASNVSECLKVVASNKIRDVPKEHHGELLQIALKAMATRPEDRYRDVVSFQQAIRNYRSHSESIALAARAEGDLERAGQTATYDDYSRAMFGFEEAITLWDGNTKAIEGSATARLRYAEAAHSKGDFDLGLSLLDRNDTTHQSLIEQLEAGKKERLAKVTRLALLRKAAAAMLAFIIVGGASAIYAIHKRSVIAIEARQLAENAQRQSEVSAANERAQKLVAVEKTEEALRAQKSAESEREKAWLAAKAEAEAKQAAVESSKIAIMAEAEAVKEKERAEQEKREADDARAAAVKARELAEYESYISNISLAKARIDQNEFNEARRILTELKANTGIEGPAWEWRWLWRQTTQSISSIVTDSPVRSLEPSVDQRSMATVLDNGVIQLVNVGADGIVASSGGAHSLASNSASAVVVSPDRKLTIVGTRSGDMEIWDHGLQNKLSFWTAHKTTVNRIRFIDQDTLVSASDDNSIRVWDLTSQSELASCWNLGPVKDFAVRPRDNGYTLVAAIAESTSGRATVWRLEQIQNGWQSRLTGEFLNHERPVVCIDLSPDGESVVSGDVEGKMLKWRTNEAPMTNYERDIASAIRKLSNPDAKAETTKGKAVLTPYQRFIDPELLRENAQSSLAHSDRIRVVRFSRDGKTILSGGDDYAIRLWDVETTKRTKELLGHGGWVLDACFAGMNDEFIISSSADLTIRSWQPQSYITASVRTGETSDTQMLLHREEILSARLNAAGDAMVTASRDRTAVVSKIDQETMKLQRIVEFRDDADTVALKEGTQFIAQAFAIDVDNQFLYIASADGVVRAWDLERGTEKYQIKSAGLNSSLALSRDGRYLLTRSGVGDAKSILWRVNPTGNNAPQVSFKFVGHAKDSAVTAIAISPDGSKLFTADNVGIGIVWDGRTGKQIGEQIESLRGYRINAAEFTADGHDLLVASDDQQLTRLNLQTRAVVSRLNHIGFVTGLSLSSDDRFAVTISEQSAAGELRIAATLWDLKEGTSQVVDRAVSPIKWNKESKQKRERITSAQFSLDGRSFAVGKQTRGDGSGRVAIWSIDAIGKAKPTHAFEMPINLGAPQACIPLADNRMLTLNGDAAFQWSTKLDNEQSASHLISYRANASVHHANFSSDGKYVLTGSHSVKIWDVEKQKSVAKVELPHEGHLTCVEFTPKPDSRQFATSGSDGVVKLFDFDEQGFEIKESQSWFREENLPPIRRVIFSNDGAMLLAVGDGGTIRLISLVDERVANMDSPAAGHLLAAAFSSDGQYFAVGGQDNQARLWKVIQPGVASAESPIVFKGHADQIEDIKFVSSRGGAIRVLTASRDKSTRVWDPRINSENQLGREILSLREHTQGVTAVDATENGNVVITAGRDAEVVLWPASPVEPPALKTE